MTFKLLSTLRDELEKSNLLLTEVSRLAANTQVNEDGSRKPKTKKKRKKLKLTPEQRKKKKEEEKIVKRVKLKLKDRKYKSTKTNREMSFSYALSRKHPKAKKDFNDAMAKAKGSSGQSSGGSDAQPKKKKNTEVTYSPSATFNEEQVDIIKKLLDQGDQLEFNNLPLIVERALKSALEAALQAHETIDEEEAQEAQEETPKKKKPRKPRSDKGVPRGPRVKKKLDETLSKEDKEKVDVEKLSEVPKEDVSETKDVLDERAKEREEQTGEQEPENIEEIEDFLDVDEVLDDIDEVLDEEEPPPLPKEDPIPEAPLAEQPSYVQKEEIKDRLEESFRQALDPEGVNKQIKLLEETLEDIVDEKEKSEIEDKIKQLRENDPLSSTRKETKTLRNRINDSVDALDGLTEKQVETMMEYYGDGANKVNETLRKQGLQGLKDYLEGELASYEKDGPPTPPKSLKQLKEDLQKQKDEAVALEHDLVVEKKKEVILNKIVEELRGLNTADEISAKVQEYEKKKEVVALWGSSASNPFSSTGGYGAEKWPDLDEMIEEMNKQKEEVKETSSKLEDKKKDAKATLNDVNDYESVQNAYAQKVGTYLALQNAQNGIIEDPEFGIKELRPMSMDDDDRKEHLVQVRRAQSERFRGMEKDERDKMVKNISDSITEVVSEIAKANDEEVIDILEGRLANLKATQSALNVVRQINSEGVIQTDPPLYDDIPDHMLELARQSESKVWDEALARLSEGGSSPEDVKREIRDVTENLGTEDFKAVVGGTSGPFGDMVELLDDNYCPGSAVNNAKDKGDRKMGPGEECPNPLSDEMKDLLREYMSDSFVDLYTISKETRRDYGGRGDKSDQVSKKVKDNMRYFWKERKDKFFEAFVDGVDESTGREYTEEERIAVAEEFHMQWKLNNMQSLNEGIELYGDSFKRYRWKELMGELERIKGLSPVEMRKRRKEIRETLNRLFDDSVTSDSEEEGTKKQGTYFNSLFINPRNKSGGTKIMQKRSTQYVDYQRRSQAFELGMRVYPFLGGNPSRSGLVVAVFPAIGMVDVQFPHGSMRFPVEDLVVDTSGDYLNIYSDDLDTVPGGVGTVPVSSRAVKKQASRVASKYVKKAIYWYKKDRTYRQCKHEDKPCCPKCKTPLGKTVYKRRGGRSEKLLACYSCLFIIKPEDIVKG